MRRKDREMDSQFGRQIIDKADYGVLSMIDDEKPYGLPLSIVRNEDVLYFHSAKEGRKVEVLGNNSNVSVVFVGDNKIPEYSPTQLEEIENDATKAMQLFTTEFESAIVTGTVDLVVDEAEKIEAMRLICEKYTPDKMRHFDSAIHSGLKRTNVYRIEIDNIAAKRKKYDENGVEMKWGRME